MDADDLPPWAEGTLAETVRQVHAMNPGTGVEILVPDFSGKPELLGQVFDAAPQVFAHNLETVPRIFKRIRPAFRYERSLDVLTQGVFAWMEPFLTNIYNTTAILYWVAFVYHFFLASEISMLGTSIPLVMAFAKQHGFHPLLLGLIWTFSAGGKLFAYQSGVLIVGYSYGYFQPRDLLKMGAWLTVIEFVLLMLLVPFYWPLIGIR